MSRGTCQLVSDSLATCRIVGRVASMLRGSWLQVGDLLRTSGQKVRDVTKKLRGETGLVEFGSERSEERIHKLVLFFCKLNCKDYSEPNQNSIVMVLQS